MSTDPAPDLYRERFEFLFPGSSPRYRLCPPDLLELRWSVFDLVEKRTVALAGGPEFAVDIAMDVIRHRQPQPETP